jgi:hypothetical protein
LHKIVQKILVTAGVLFNLNFNKLKEKKGKGLNSHPKCPLPIHTKTSITKAARLKYNNNCNMGMFN